MLLRDPADVPAPVAIALADFCRRADRPAPAEEVRQALARLSPDEDAAVLRLCAAEPQAKPLSPHAVVDVIRGLPAREAARREAEDGYAAIARAAAEAARDAAARESDEAAAPAVGSGAAQAGEAENPFAPGEETQRARIRAAVEAAAGDLEKAADALGLEDAAALRRLAGKLGVLAEILAAAGGARGGPDVGRRTRKAKAPAPPGPIRRPRAEVEALRARREAAPRVEAEEAPPAPRPGRRPAAPQFGRYVSGPPVRRPFAELEAPSGRAIVEDLVTELRANRRQIVERLDALWARPDGRPIGDADFDRLLTRHGLAAWWARVERENLRVLLRQHRGFLPAVRRTLRLDARELQQLLRRYGLEADVAELKERTREDARTERPLADRIAFVADKEEILRDAGVLEELDERNLAALRPAIEAAAAGGASTEPTVVVELARRALGIEPRIWRKAVRRYRLAHLAAGLLGVPPPEEPPGRRAAAGGERAPPARTNLPVRGRATGPRREVPVTRMGSGGRPPAGARFGAGAGHPTRPPDRGAGARPLRHAANRPPRQAPGRGPGRPPRPAPRRPGGTRGPGGKRRS